MSLDPQDWSTTTLEPLWKKLAQRRSAAYRASRQMVSGRRGSGVPGRKGPGEGGAFPPRSLREAGRLAIPPCDLRAGMSGPTRRGSSAQGFPTRRSQEANYIRRSCGPTPLAIRAAGGRAAPGGPIDFAEPAGCRPDGDFQRREGGHGTGLTFDGTGCAAVEVPASNLDPGPPRDAGDCLRHSRPKLAAPALHARQQVPCLSEERPSRSGLRFNRPARAPVAGLLRPCDRHGDFPGRANAIHRARSRMVSALSSFPLAERSVKPAWKMRVFPALRQHCRRGGRCLCSRPRLEQRLWEVKKQDWRPKSPRSPTMRPSALSPDGNTYAVVNAENAIKVRSVASNQVVRTIDLDPMSRFAVRGNGTRAEFLGPRHLTLRGWAGGVQVFAVDSGAAVWEGEFRQFQSPLACSANGRFLIGTTGANAKTRYNREYKYFDMPCCTCSGRYVKS